MKILWLNFRKRGRNAFAVQSLKELIESKDADLVFLQETFGGESQALHIDLKPLKCLLLSKDLSLFCNNLSKIKHVTYSEPFLMSALAGDTVILNVHLSAYSSAERTMQLARINEILDLHAGKSVIVGGDFNMAPQENDGLFDGATSTWTRPSERTAFKAILEQHDLLDILASVQPRDFTLERQQKGKLSQFRCDLILASSNIDGRGEALHQTRLGSTAFTDHSGLFFSVDTKADETI